MEKEILQKYFFIGILLASTVLMFFLFLPFLNVVALAVILAIVLNPIYKYLLSRFKGKRGWTALVVVLLFIILILIPTILLSLKLMSEAGDLYKKLTDTGEVGYLETLTQALEAPIQRFSPGFTIDTAEYIRSGSDFILSHITRILSSVFNILTGIVFIFFSLFFFLKDGSMFKKILIDLSPLKDSYDEHIFIKMKQAVLATVKGVLFIALIQGLLAGLGMKIFGVSNPTLWGSVAAIASLVPAIGTALVFIPVIIFTYISGHHTAAIGLFVWWALLVSTVDNFLGPYLYSRGVEIHPLIMLFAVLGGLALFGPVGFLFGPVSVALFFSLVEIYQDTILKTPRL